MSATSTTWSSPSASIASVTMSRPVSSRARASSSSPARPSPWNEYGELRGLKAPARRTVAPGLAHGAGGREDLALALDRAGARHHHDLVAADGEPAGQPDDGGLRLPLAGHLLVRLGDVDDFLDAGQRGQPGAVHPAVVAHQPDRGALLARHRPRLVAHLLDGGDDPPNLVLGRAVAHDDQHAVSPGLSICGHPERSEGP